VADLRRLADQGDGLAPQRLQLGPLGRQRPLGRGQVRLGGGERALGVLAGLGLRVRAARLGDHPREHPDPDPVPSDPRGERGLRPEVGPDRRPQGEGLLPDLHAAVVELALLRLELLHLPPQRCQLPFQGGPLGLQLGGLPAHDRLLGQKLRLLLLEPLLLGLERRLLPLERRLLSLERVGLGRQLLLLAFQVGLVALAWLYLSSYSLLGWAGGSSLVAVSRGPL
jgi:hypothetical protein